MDILSKLNTAVEYIEKNLTNEISYKEVAKLTNSSPYNFHRMFNYITGFSITEYVRKRRLTSAAFELQGGNKKVIDIALKYGFDSPVSFARAFRSFHGISPSKVQKKKCMLKAFPRLSFKIHITGDKEMNYRIIEQPEFKAFGIEKEIFNNGDLEQIPNFFDECIKNGTFNTIKQLGQEKYFYENMPTISGIGCGKKGNDKTHTYMIGSLVFNDTQLPDGYAHMVIPAHIWAVFETVKFKDGTGDDIKIIQELWKRIFQEWLPSSCYELADLPNIEQDHFDNPDACFVEIWIPVSKI